MEDQYKTNDMPNYVPLSTPITFAFVSALLLALPAFLNTAGGGDSVGIANMADIISATAYIMGIGFGMKAILKFKEHSEGFNGTDMNFKNSLPENENLVSEENNANQSKSISQNLHTSNINMDDKVLNEKVNAIIKKIENLLLMDTLKNDIENRILLENTKSQYLPKIAMKYRRIPLENRKIKINNQNSPYDIVYQQINVIAQGIKEIEIFLLNEQTKEMRVMNRLLETKFPQSKIEKELNS